MVDFDPLGSTWGTGGVRRAPVWNSAGQGRVLAPTLLIRGDLDTTVSEAQVLAFTGTWSGPNKEYSCTLTTRVRALRPGTKVVYMSGYTDDTLAFYGLPQPDTSYIHKPLTPVALAEKLRQVLSTVGRKH